MISYFIELLGDILTAVCFGGMFDIVLMLLILISGLVVIKNIRQAIT